MEINYRIWQRPNVVSHLIVYKRDSLRPPHPARRATLSPRGGRGTGGEGVQANRPCRQLTATRYYGLVVREEEDPTFLAPEWEPALSWTGVRSLAQTRP